MFSPSRASTLRQRRPQTSSDAGAKLIISFGADFLDGWGASVPHQLDFAEAQVAVRAGQRFVARLVRWHPSAPASNPPPTVPAGDQPFRLEIAAPGEITGGSPRPITPRSS